MGFCLEGHYPIHSKDGYSMGLGLKLTFMLWCPRSAGLGP